jgi:hypothetical protein
MISHCRFSRYRNADLIYGVCNLIHGEESLFSYKLCDKSSKSTRQIVCLLSQASTKTLRQCYNIGKQAIGNIWHRYTLPTCFDRAL